MDDTTASANTPSTKTPASAVSLTPAPEPPPYTPAERAILDELRAKLIQKTARLRQQNLDNAVLLAQRAARDGGELVPYFSELGRRFGHLLDTPPRAALRVIDGGAS